MIDFIYKVPYLIFLSIYYCVLNTIRFFIPTKYLFKSIKNDIVLITGAGNGIGRCLAFKLAKYGCTLILLDIDQKSNDEVRDLINENHGKAHSFKCDVTCKEEVYKLASKIEKEIGKVSILINNAGILHGKKLLDLSDSQIERIFNINIISQFWTVRAFLPNMIKINRGHIVALASTAGSFGVNKLVDYCTTKHAVIGFMSSLKNEINDSGLTGIKTTVISPNYTNTGMCNGVTSLAPLLEPDSVANEIVNAILTEKEFVFVPRLVWLFIYLRCLLPTQAFDYLYDDLYGAGKSMNTFLGNSKKN